MNNKVNNRQLDTERIRAAGPHAPGAHSSHRNSIHELPDQWTGVPVQNRLSSDLSKGTLCRKQRWATGAGAMSNGHFNMTARMTVK